MRPLQSAFPVALALAALLPTRVTAQQSTLQTASLPAPQVLSMSDITRLVSNNTLVGVSANGSPYRAYFAGDGSVRFNNAAITDQGTWHVSSEGQLCTTLPHVNQAEHCYTIAMEGRVILYEANGVPEGSFRVVTGNPMGL
ncbi:MAG TPA: hypothetical protein VLV50_01080 [Stellaceae bacterium]|nr:hypothetical protein [Stellaceae bacterium]